MASIERVNSRPFGQSKYKHDLLRPTFEGDHYKFTILLPVTEFSIGREADTKIVFTREDRGRLRDLLRKDFGGVTHSLDGKHPLIEGDWIDRKGNVVVNQHMLFEIYAQKNDEAIAYFKELKVRLMRHIKNIRHMAQKIIVIERLEVNFTPDSTEEILWREKRLKERIKYLRGG